VQFIWPEGFMKLIGIVLIVVGVVALALGGFSYTTREKVLDLGPIQATTEKNHTVPLSPIVGIAALVGGIAVLAAGSRTRA
jgi:drug/metabolite transporter (DMT)-like permease